MQNYKIQICFCKPIKKYYILMIITFFDFQNLNVYILHQFWILIIWDGSKCIWKNGVWNIYFSHELNVGSWIVFTFEWDEFMARFTINKPLNAYKPREQLIHRGKFIGLWFRDGDISSAIASSRNNRRWQEKHRDCQWQTPPVNTHSCQYLFSSYPLEFELMWTN